MPGGIGKPLNAARFGIGNNSLYFRGQAQCHSFMVLKKLILFLIIITCLVYDASAKKRYSINRVNIEAVVHPDGSMTVRETRVYNFQGEFTYAYREFPKQGNLEFTDFVVMANGKPLPQSQEEEKDHFVIINKKDYTEVGWAFSAKDEVKVFTITYSIENIIQRYEDVAVLYYKFLDQQWKVNQENVFITISFSGENEELPAIRHWLHGPAHAYSEIGTEGEILIDGQTIPSKNSLEIRALYPEHWFPDVPQINKSVAQEIMIEEKIWAEEANERRLAAIARVARFNYIYEWAPAAIFSLYVFTLVLVFWIYRTYRRDEVVSRTNVMEVKPPSELHPALINYLLMGYNLGYELNATLYKLAQRRILAIEDRNEEGKNSKKQLYWILDKGRYKSDNERLMSFELEIIESLFSENKTEISFSETSNSPTKFQQMLANFNKLVREEGRKLEIWNKESMIGRNIMIGLTSFIFVMFLVSIVFFQIWSLFVLFLFGVMVFLTVKIRQRNPKYQEEYYRWVSYRKYLKSTLSRKSNREINYELVNEHLIYGTVFGLTKNQMTRLLESVPQDNYHMYLYWYVILHGNKMQPATMSKTISHMAGNLAASTMSSGGGTGGGASFGGGGGFSAGGGGAR